MALSQSIECTGRSVGLIQAWLMHGIWELPHSIPMMVCMKIMWEKTSRKGSKPRQPQTHIEGSVTEAEPHSKLGGCTSDIQQCDLLPALMQKTIYIDTDAISTVQWAVPIGLQFCYFFLFVFLFLFSFVALRLVKMYGLNIKLLGAQRSSSCPFLSENTRDVLLTRENLV